MTFRASSLLPRFQVGPSKRRSNEGSRDSLQAAEERAMEARLWLTGADCQNERSFCRASLSFVVLRFYFDIFSASLSSESCNCPVSLRRAGANRSPVPPRPPPPRPRPRILTLTVTIARTLIAQIAQTPRTKPVHAKLLAIDWRAVDPNWNSFCTDACRRASVSGFKLDL